MLDGGDLLLRCRIYDKIVFVPPLRVLAAETRLPRPAIVTTIYHMIALTQTRAGAEIVLGAACFAAAKHGVLDQLVDRLKAKVVASRKPGERGQ